VAALAADAEAIRLGETLGSGLTTVIMFSFSAWVHYLRGDSGTARAHAQRNLALSEAHGFAAWNDGLPVLACIAADSGGDVWETLRQFIASPGRAAWRNVVSLCLLAEALGRLGESGRGLEALDLIPEPHRTIILAAEVERVRGALLLHRGQLGEAELRFRRALELARQRQERSLELRAATSLARLLDGRGKRDEARALLDPVYRWFTEGFDTKDLREARALLDTLA
jgi:adenylate cyclase